MDDLYLVDILGPNDENILGGHGEPTLNVTFKAQEVFINLADGFGQHFNIGNTNLFLTGQQHVDITILQVTFPDGLFRSHGLVVETVDKSLVSVDLVTTLVKLGQIGGQDIADDRIHAFAQTQITLKILLFCINHSIVLRLECHNSAAFPYFGIFMIAFLLWDYKHESTDNALTKYTRKHRKILHDRRAVSCGFEGPHDEEDGIGLAP